MLEETYCFSMGNFANFCVATAVLINDEVVNVCNSGSRKRKTLLVM